MTTGGELQVVSLFAMSNEEFPFVMSSGRRHLFVGFGWPVHVWRERGDFSQGST